MSTGEGPLTYAIDVGGERFLLNTDKSVDLAYKGKRDFYSIFSPISKSTNIPMERIEFLFRTYLPYPMEKTNPFIFALGSKDKEDLVRIIEARIDQIKETRIHTLANTNLLNILKSLLETIDQIQFGSRTGKPGKKRKPLTENEIFSLILEFSWYLMHPNMEINDDWEAMIKKLDTKSLDTLTREIQVEEEKQGVGPTTHKTALNYFKNIDINDVIHQPTKEQAMKRIKNMVLFPGSETGKEIKTRLKNLMAILTMKGFIEEPLEYRESIPVIKNADLYEAKFQMPQKLIKGGGEKKEEKKEVSPLSLSLGKAMTPFFDYFKEMYDPIYGFMEEAMKEFEKENPSISTGKLMNELISLLYVCTHLPPSAEGSIPKGVYRIQHVDPIAIEFVSFMLGYTEKTKLQGKSQEEKDDFLGHLFKLPVFRLSTHKGKTTTKAYTDPATLPYVQMMIMGRNLFTKNDAEFANQPSGMVKRYDAIRPFFQDNAIYLVVSDSNLSKDSLTPMTLFTIDYRSIQMDKAHVTVTHEEEFSTIMENGSEIMLEQVMNTNKTSGNGSKSIFDHGELVFNHGELIMCILQTLKKQMPQ